MNVRGALNDIVLVDPQGRVDRYSDTLVVADIPECSRWPGGLGEFYLEDPLADSAAVATTSFELGFVENGTYVLHGRADEVLDTVIEATFSSDADSGGTGAGDVRIEHLKAGRYMWTITLQSPPNEGERGLHISAAARRESPK